VLWRFGRCSVHLHKKRLPALRLKHPLKKSNYGCFVFHWQAAAKFPGVGWHKAAWAAVARHYRRKGEDKFIDAVEKSFLDPATGGTSIVGSHALGMATSINCVEQGNLWFRRQIAEELHSVEAHATLPTSLTVLVDILQNLWPRWMASSGASEFRKPSTHEDRSRREFLIELNANKSQSIRLNGDDGDHTCFAFKQKWLHGPLYPLAKRSAKAAVSAWAAGPTPSMPWDRFILMSQITFTTAQHCFPCWSWGSKGGCYHQDAVREHLGLPPLTNPKDRKTSQSKGRGRKRRARARHFSAGGIANARSSTNKKTAHRWV
jgi:hypothetical protein